MSHGINAASLPATVDAIAWVLHAAGIRAPTTRPAR
jgi:hypothetical protein